MSSTRARVVRLSMFWLAVSATILATACAKKNRRNEDAPPAPTVVKEQAPPPAPPVKRDTPPPNDPSKTPPGGELDGDSSRSSQEPGAPPVVEEKVERRIIPYDPRGLTPDEIYTSSDQRPPADMSNVPSDLSTDEGEKLFFSGAGMDDLREQLHAAVEATLDEEVKQINAQFAAGVTMSTFEVNEVSGRVRATVTLKRGGKPQQFIFAGTLNNKGIFRSGDVKVAPFVALDMACMDRGAGCQTAHIRIRDGHRNQVRTAHIIARQSSSDIHIDAPGFGVARNPEYDRLLGLLVDTINNPNGSNKVDRISFVTSETINGPSMFWITTHFVLSNRYSWTGSSSQMISFMGPLVKPENSSILEQKVEVVPSVTTIDGLPVRVNGLLSDTVQTVRLIRNDGRGNLKFAITVRQSHAKGSEETFHLLFARKHKPVRQLVLSENN